MDNSLLQQLIHLKNSGKKSLAVLIDPDSVSSEYVTNLVINAEQARVDYYFVGGSLMVNVKVENCIKQIKSLTNRPVILFPGSVTQVCQLADGILFLSLISGRNADLLIGQHVLAAPMLKKSDIEVLPTGYMLIDGGKPTTVSYVSQTQPIPANKPDIAVCTAMAGELLGLQLMYMDAGSGADVPVNSDMIKQVKGNINVPLIVGGGIKTKQQAINAAISGADVIVMGNAFESNPELVFEIADELNELNNIKA